MDDPKPQESGKQRVRDTRGRAGSVDVNYPKNPHWFRTWQGRLLAIAALGAALFVFIILHVRGGKRLLANGPVARAHVLIEANCEACHSESINKVIDTDCLMCHAGPVHHLNQDRRPRCAECHTEHKGSRVLSEVADSKCTGCHSQLD